MLPVVIGLSFLAIIAVAMNRESARLAAGGDMTMDAERARYLAEAALQQASWQLQKSDCTGYNNLASTFWGPDTYSATVGTSSGSPVTVTAIGTTATGASRTLSRSIKTYKTSAQNIVLQPDAAAGKDTYIETGNNKNYGGSGAIWLFPAYDVPLIQFDLSSIPADSRILSAQLALYQSSNGNGGANDSVGVHRLNRGWKEGTQNGGGVADGVSWFTTDGITPWNTPGGDYDPIPITRNSNIVGQGWKTWDITGLVSDWIAGNQLNYGLALQATAGVGNVKYVSSDDSNAANRPKLIIDYVCECGKPCGPTTGPIAHWQLDETSGTTAVDAVGGHTGTLNGGTWTTGHLGGGLSLNGTSNFVAVASAATLSPTSFTLAAWIKPAALSGYRMVLNKGTSGNNRNYWLGTTGSQISFGWYNGARREFNTTTANFLPSTWYHIAASYDDTSKQVKVYLNGTLLLTQTATVLPITNSEGITLGSSPSGEYWQGVLDDIWILQGALSDTEIAALAGGTSVTVTFPATQDSYIKEDKASQNFGLTNPLILGGDPGKNKAIIGLFNFSDIGTIPAGSTIQSASLRVYGVKGSGTAELEEAHLATSSWTETGVTWNNRPGVDPTVVSSTTINDVTGWETWDVTPLVQQWVDGISPNYGIALQRPAGAGGNPQPQFKSREAGNLTPELVVTYQ